MIEFLLQWSYGDILMYDDLMAMWYGSYALTNNAFWLYSGPTLIVCSVGFAGDLSEVNDMTPRNSWNGLLSNLIFFNRQ